MHLQVLASKSLGYKWNYLERTLGVLQIFTQPSNMELFLNRVRFKPSPEANSRHGLHPRGSKENMNVFREVTDGEGFSPEFEVIIENSLGQSSGKPSASPPQPCLSSGL